MHRLLLVAALASACAPVESKVVSGTYTSGKGDLSGATLAVDVGAKTATLTPSTGAAIALTLSATSTLTAACQQNMASVNVETFALTPDPLLVATLSIGRPQLRAGCGVDASGNVNALPNTVVLGGTVGTHPWVNEFTR